MRTKPFAVLFIAAALAVSAQAQSIRVAILDFSVQSDDPRFKYLGKGFAELTAVEVSHIPGVTLIDRERRNALLAEQEFALSGAADEGTAVEVGKLLAADYLVSGSIIDMLGNLLVSYQVVRTDTGAIVGKEKTEGPPAEYRRMVGEIGAGIRLMTKKIAIAAASQPTPAAPPAAAKQEAVLSTFSEAVAALDNKDVKTAQVKLEEARALDPNDPAVKYYLDKLARGTSKFAVIPQAYYALDNPATLALRDGDSSYFYSVLGGTYLTGNSDWPTFKNSNANFLPQMVKLSGQYGQFAGGSSPGPAPYAVREIDGSNFIGYETPIASGLGLGAQVYFSHRENNLFRYDPGFTATDVFKPGWDSIDFYGGVLSVGWAPLPWLSVGLAGTAGGYSGSRSDWQTPNGSLPTSVLFGGELGLVLRNADGSLSFAFCGGLSSYRTSAFDLDTITLKESNQLTAFTDFSLTWGLNRLQDFLVLKYVADMYGLGVGSLAPSLQLLPAYEHWFGQALSLRASGVVTLVPSSTLYVGFGGTLGATLVFGGLEVDLGATYMNRPSQVAYSEIIPETVFSIGVRMNGLFTRK